jgi:diaminopropionate ammonia-lyase
VGERIQLRAGGAHARVGGREDLRLTRALVNSHLRSLAVPPPRVVARGFHRKLEGYAPTPLRDLPVLAAEAGLAGVSVKDETDRLGLPSFKILGASWAAELALGEAPGTHTLVAASAGNHGRAVARVAAVRGLGCRVLLPARSDPARRDAIAAEGADVVVVDGDYEDAVRLAAEAGGEPGVLEIADVGGSFTAHAVIDGYATLFDEIAEQADASIDVLMVPVGVGSLAAAAARFGAAAGARVIGVEPTAAAGLTASLAAGAPTAVPTPGTAMAGMDCAEVSVAAWPLLREGVAGTVLVEDSEIPSATEALAAAGMQVGECGAAPVAALRALTRDPAAVALRDALEVGPGTHAVLVATEGLTH